MWSRVKRREAKRAGVSEKRNKARQRREERTSKELERIECLREVGEGGGFGVEGGDGFDEARDGEGVANAAGSADQAEHAAFARELDGDAHERGEAGAINLRRAVEPDDDFAHALLHNGLQGAVKLLAGFADSEPAMHFENGRGAGFANLNLHG